MKNNISPLQKKNRQIFSIRSFSVLFIIIGLLSCETNSLSELAVPEETEVGEIPVDPETPVDPMVPLVTYDGNAKAILDNTCVECHNAGNPTSGVALDTYTSAILFIERGLARMMNASNPMPPSGRIDADLIDDIESWINDGLLEN